MEYRSIPVTVAGRKFRVVVDQDDRLIYVKHWQTRDQSPIPIMGPDGRGGLKKIGQRTPRFSGVWLIVTDKGDVDAIEAASKAMEIIKRER